MKSFFKSVFTSCLGVVLATAFLFLFFTLIFGFFASKVSQKKTSLEDNSLLYLDMAQAMPEKTNNIPIDIYQLETGNVVGVTDILKLINHAKTDDKIKGIYLKVNPSLGLSSNLAEVRSALDDFKTSKKFIYAYADEYSQSSYYLCSVADKIFLNPVGDLSFKGLGISLMYFKNLLEKLNVKPNIFYVGKFKSATEPFRSDKMSDPNRLQLKEYLSGLFSQVVDEIALSRKIDPKVVSQVANDFLIKSPEDALKYRFVDEISYENEVIDLLKSKLKIKDGESVNLVNINTYFDAVTLKKDYSAKDKIAVVYAEGEINDSDSSEGEIGGANYVKILRKIRNDKNVKALVLRINSPGGSAFASEQIAHEIDLLKQNGIKVIVSMSNYAASGGYYIACGADSIFASSKTLTGSIGIFGMIPDLSGFYKNKLLINVDSVKTGPHAIGITNIYSLSTSQSEYIQKYIERGYDVFLNRIVKGRKLPKTYIDSIAQGRIYGGQTALKLKLVDKIGDLDDAIASAAKMLGSKSYRLVEYPESKTQIEKILEELQGSKDEKINAAIHSELNKIAPELLEAKKLMSNNAIQARLPFTIVWN